MIKESFGAYHLFAVGGLRDRPIAFLVPPLSIWVNSSTNSKCFQKYDMHNNVFVSDVCKRTQCINLVIDDR